MVGALSLRPDASVSLSLCHTTRSTAGADILRQEATELRRALDNIQKRLAEIEEESSQA